MTILNEIQQNYNRLPNKEKQIAKYILEKSDELKNINIKELAEETGTSISTITRFCRHVRCDSFVDLKMRVNTAATMVPSLGYDDLFEEVYSFYHKVIDNTVKLIEPAKIREVVQYIQEAKRVYICGVGSSGLTAVEMSQRLIRMGLNVISVNDPHMMIITSSITTKEDFVIGISNSGNTPELVTALKIAKKNKSKVATFTSFENSEMTEISDVTIPVNNTLFVSKRYFANSQFSIMYVMDIISMMLLQNESYRDNMEKTINTVTDEFH